MINWLRDWCGDSRVERIKTVLLVALFFAFLGWALPTGNALIQPPDRYVEIENVSVSDVNRTADSNTVYVAWDAAENYPANVTTTLYRVTADGHTTKVGHFHFRALVEQGENNATLSYPIPPDMKSGAYYYDFSVKVRVRPLVTKDVTFSTTVFTYGNATERAHWRNQTVTVDSRGTDGALAVFASTYVPLDSRESEPLYAPVKPVERKSIQNASLPAIHHSPPVPR